MTGRAPLVVVGNPELPRLGGLGDCGELPTAPRDRATIVDRLAPDGRHVERWFPEAGLGAATLRSGRFDQVRAGTSAGRAA